MFFNNPDKFIKGITNIIDKLVPTDQSEQTDKPFCNIYDTLDKYIIYIEDLYQQAAIIFGLVLLESE